MAYSSYTSIILYKGEQFNAMASDSRRSSKSLKCVSNTVVKIFHAPNSRVFVASCGSCNIFESVKNDLSVYQGVRFAKWIAERVKQSVNDYYAKLFAEKDEQQIDQEFKLNRVGLYVMDDSVSLKVSLKATPHCKWHHDIEEINEQVVFMGSGSANLKEYYDEKFPSGHANMDEDEAVDFLKNAVQRACMRNWGCGGHIHVVVSTPNYWRRKVWQQKDQNYRYCWAPYHLLHDKKVPMP